MKKLLSVPNEYNGKFEDFYRDYIEPNLPDPKDVQIAHNILLNYLKNENPFYVLRNFSSYQRRGHQYSVDNYKFVVGDNEPALWFYARTCNQLLTPSDSFLSILQNQIFPIGFSTDSKKLENKNEWKNWKKEKWENEFSYKGWFHAHLFDAAENIDSKLFHDNLKMRMIRYLHPANHFPMPGNLTKITKFKTRLDSKDMSEQKGIKAFICNKYKQRYCQIWDEFISIANIKNDNFIEVSNVQISFEKVEKKLKEPVAKIHNTPLNITTKHVENNFKNIKAKQADALLVLLVKDQGIYPNVYRSNGVLEILATYQTIINKLDQFSGERIYFQKDQRIFSSGLVERTTNRDGVYYVSFISNEKLNMAPLGRSYGAAFYIAKKQKSAA